MSNTNAKQIVTLTQGVLYTALLFLLLLACRTVAKAQGSTGGSSPLALTGGTPAGSYSLSEIDNINLFNGNLNFRLPLLSVGGRGSARHTISLPIEKKWFAEKILLGQTGEYLWYFNDYLPGAIRPGYGPGVLQAYRSGYFPQTCAANQEVTFMQTLTKMVFTAPGGTEFELLSTNNPSVANVQNCNPTQYNRGRVFRSKDGSGATFISDSNILDLYVVEAVDPTFPFLPSGYLLLPDGSRLRIDNGRVSWNRDRNGNRITFSYDQYSRITTITDQLNRQVTINYNVSDPAPFGNSDQIIYKGFGGASRTIRVSYSSLSSALRTTQPGDPAAGQTCYGLSATAYNPTVVSSVWLPDGVRRYKLLYNCYGELARVELPTGAAFEYDHGAGLLNGPSDGTFERPAAQGGTYPQVYRRVVERRVYANGSTLAGKMTYGRSETYNTSVLNYTTDQGYVDVDLCEANGTRISRQRHYFLGSASPSLIETPAYNPPGLLEGKESQTQSLHGDGNTILQKVINTWENGTSWQGPHINETVTTLVDSNQVAKRTFAYDQYNNPTDIYDYDYGNGVPGSLIRRTHTDYLTDGYDTLNPSSASPDLNLTSHIRNLPKQISIFDAGGIERARSKTEYDNYVFDGSGGADCLHSFHCPLQPRSNISGFDSLLGASYTKRGNPTASTSYLLSNGTVTGSVSAYSHYDIAGNVIRRIDPRSTPSAFIVTSIEYDDRFGTPDTEARLNSVPSELTGFTSFAFPTKVINALGHTSYAQFDYYLGQAVNGEDANGVVAAGYFNDVLDRPTQIRRGVGTGAANQTTFAYDDGNRTVTTSSDKDAYGDNLLVSKVVYDHMGRIKETRQYEGGSNYIVTQTQYDALDRPFKNSNPFRPWKNETAVWTTQAFDAFGRVTSVTTPDGATVATAYSADRILVTDQAGKQRMSRTNALGQLKDVWEITTPDAATEALSFPSHPEVTAGYRTTYDYNVLANLKTVAQGSQTRAFDYDSLGRLKSATNPESGTVTYEYDNSSNLKQKTDARNVVTTYGYDELNRNTSVTYSDGTMAIGRAYDQTTNGKGRLSWEWQCANANICGSLTSFNYDALGRVADQHQQFWISGNWGPAYSVFRAYDLAGNVISQRYPSGRTVSYSYDSADRTIIFAGNLGDGVQRTYATSIQYSPFGGITKEQFGTQQPRYHHQDYNIRGQLYYIAFGPTNDDWGGDYGKLIYYYGNPYCFGCSGPENNGNIRLIDYYLPGGYLIHDHYSYDSLNRLSDHMEEDTAQQYRQQYSYDRWGNRTINPASWGTGINTKQFTVNTANNQLGVPAGQSGAVTYDNAGNLTTDTYSGLGNRIYDAENKIVAAQDIYAGWSYYTYNARGQRVKRKINNQETWQIYGIDGELVAEYATNGAVSTPKKEYGYRDGQLLVTADGVSGTNVALASNGGTATASSTLSPYVASHVIDGSRRAINGTGWLDNTLNSFPDWVEVSFNGNQTIKEINVITQQDDPSNPVEPSLLQTFSLYGITAFEVQYWNGSSWATVPGANVTGNNKVWRQFTFSPITTSKIRVLVNAGADNALSRLVEVEAWTESSAVNINWLLPDHLGTPRIIIDQTGSLANVRRHDYLPFGEELFAGTGGRTAAQGFSPGDGVRQQFTQKERDVETGLDYFLARYYSNSQGRFTSVDPDNAQGRDNLNDPQGWNAYSYVGNNPLTRTDPDGRLMDLQASEAWQRFRNWLYYERPVTDAQLKKEVQQKREELKANLRAMDGHEYSAEEFDRMGTRQVLSTYDRYRLGIDAGVARTVSQPPMIPGPVVNAANVPQHAQDTLKQIDQTGKAPPGYRGGRTFANDGRAGGESLPKTDAQGNQITYREYDAQPYQKGVNRGAERIVRGSDGSAYYTSDHYKTFTKIR